MSICVSLGIRDVEAASLMASMSQGHTAQLAASSVNILVIRNQMKLEVLK